MEEPAPESGFFPAPDGASPAGAASGAEEASPGGWAIFLAVAREVVETIVLALVMVFLIQLVIRNFRVEGHSMAPNLQNGQYLVVDKLSYKLPFGIRPPQRGDVIVFVPPHQPDRDFVKRIIGLPGETVEIRRGQVYINGEPLPNTFGARLDRSAMPPTVVPEGSLFVLGDNRPNSNDSRNWGMLDMNHVVGRVWLSYWPPERWGLIPNDAPAASATLRHLLTQMSASP
ncbi:MAG: signal peptidase I [Caldilineae bacterium]|nr:MAG: signal peptidase I [Caldilineae bacterium]